MPEVTGQVTEDQANAALQQLAGGEPAAEQPQETVAEPSAEAEAQSAEPAAEVPPAEAAEEPVAVAEDDLESLKTRLGEMENAAEKSEENFNARLRASQERNSANEQILRDRYLRKSNVADRALKVLRETRSEAGVSEADVDSAIREMEGTMHKDSASYVAPQAPADGAEDQALVLNSFLNEQRMTTEEADEFGKWIRSDATTVMSPAEQAVANESLGGFLRLAHGHWRNATSEQEKEGKRSDAVGAVRSVQRTQRAAARAASASTTAPKKQPVGAAETVDVSNLTPDDISALVRRSVTQYR